MEINLKKYVEKNYWILIFQIAFLLIILMSIIAAIPDLGKCSVISQKILSPFCHQRTDRSLYLFDHKLGLCTRCFSLYLSMLFTSIAGSLTGFEKFKKIPLFILILFFLVMPIDGISLFMIKGYSSPVLWRSFTGILFGFALIAFFFPIIDKLQKEIYELKQETSK